MIIDAQLQINCSEVVFQLCGITKEIAEQMKEEFKNLLKDKYKEDYLNNYAVRLFAVPGKYHLNFCRYDGSNSGPDYDTILEIAQHYPEVYNDYISCCSGSIDTDEDMEKHLEWRTKKDA